MKLTDKAIEGLPKGGKSRKRLAYELDVHPTTIDRWIDLNEEDGNLTTFKSVNVIGQETDLTMDEILTEEKAHA